MHTPIPNTVLAAAIIFVVVASITALVIERPGFNNNSTYTTSPKLKSTATPPPSKEVIQEAETFCITLSRDCVKTCNEGEKSIQQDCLAQCELDYSTCVDERSQNGP